MQYDSVQQGAATRNLRYDGRPGAIVVANGASAERLGADAVDLAGARTVARFDWTTVETGLADYAAMDLLTLDATDVADAALDAALPAIDAFARDCGTRIVAVLDDRQIDLVAGHLFGRHVQLLCAPSLSDRVAALAIAGAMRMDAQVNEAGDAEAARLRRLNEEVARIAETLARLTRGDTPAQERPAPGVGDRKLGYGAPPGEDAPVTPHDIRQAIRARRLRAQFFEDGLFEDPAWDMLLDLFAAELERAQVSVSSLCIAAAVAPTTALRWIAKMTDIGLFVRQPDPFDRRRAFMALSDRARDGMREYCAAIRRAGLSIA